MQDINNNITSLYPMLFCWSASFVVLLSMTFRLNQTRDRRGFKDLIGDQSGAGYTITYMMTLPIYILFVAFFFEMCLLLVAYGGTLHASFAACRVAVVWDSENDEDSVDELVGEVAVRAFVPFASGITEARMVTPSPADEREIDRYNEAYETYSQAIGSNRVFSSYAAAKYRFASRHVNSMVERNPLDKPWDEDISVTVTYNYPFGTYGVGSLLASFNSGAYRGRDGFYYFPVSATATLKNELPRNEGTALGIEYATLK